MQLGVLRMGALPKLMSWVNVPFIFPFISGWEKPCECKAQTSTTWPPYVYFDVWHKIFFLNYFVFPYSYLMATGDGDWKKKLIIMNYKDNGFPYNQMEYFFLYYIQTTVECSSILFEVYRISKNRWSSCNLWLFISLILV